jgi:D-tyrosyl-tRNA(Tyr) deacylase
MKLENKYLKESKMFKRTKIEVNDVLKVADKLVIENMNLVSKYTNQLMKEAEMKYIKNEDSMSPAAARDIFLSRYTNSYENYINGIVRSLGKN